MAECSSARAGEDHDRRGPVTRSRSVRGPSRSVGGVFPAIWSCCDTHGASTGVDGSVFGSVSSSFAEFRTLSLLARLLVVNQLGINIGFFMVLPFLATYLTDDLGYGAALVGIVLGARTLSQQGLFLLGGTAADRIGYRPVIIIGLRSAGRRVRTVLAGDGPDRDHRGHGAHRVGRRPVQPGRAHLPQPRGGGAQGGGVRGVQRGRSHRRAGGPAARHRAARSGLSARGPGGLRGVRGADRRPAARPPGARRRRAGRRGTGQLVAGGPQPPVRGVHPVRRSPCAGRCTSASTTSSTSYCRWRRSG